MAAFTRTHRSHLPAPAAARLPPSRSGALTRRFQRRSSAGQDRPDHRPRRAGRHLAAPNGSGKTTLLRCLVTHRRRADALVLGHPLGSRCAARARPRGLPARNSAFGPDALSGRENLLFAARGCGCARSTSRPRRRCLTRDELALDPFAGIHRSSGAPLARAPGRPWDSKRDPADPEADPARRKPARSLDDPASQVI